MRFPRIFLALFSISAGFAIAGALGADVALIPGLEKFKPPPSLQKGYQPSTVPTGVLGDFVWAVGQAMYWFRETPSIMQQVLAGLGVPPVIASILLSLVGISFAAWLIYMVGGRILNP